MLMASHLRLDILLKKAQRDEQMQGAPFRSNKARILSRPVALSISNVASVLLTSSGVKEMSLKGSQDIVSSDE